MNSSNKYKEGEFGYWWTVTLGNEDIDGTDYEGNLVVNHQFLTSLYGAPRSVSGGFYCGDNRLTSLKHSPKTIGVSFCCENNEITSLEHCPITVGGNFSCNGNKLTSLADGPDKIGWSLNCYDNDIDDPLSEIIDHDIMAINYYLSDKNIVEKHNITFEELEIEKQRRAQIKRQLGQFAIVDRTSPFK